MKTHHTTSSSRRHHRRGRARVQRSAKRAARPPASMSWAHVSPTPSPGWYVPQEPLPKIAASDDDFREEIRQGFRSVMTEVSSVRGDVNDLRGGMTDLRDGLKELRGDMNVLRGEMKDLRSDMKEVRSDVRHLAGEVKDLRDRVSDVRERVGVHGQALRSMQWFVGMTIALGVGISGIYATYSTNMVHARAQAMQRSAERGAVPATNPATQAVAPLARPVP